MNYLSMSTIKDSSCKWSLPRTSKRPSYYYYYYYYRKKRFRWRNV